MALIKRLTDVEFKSPCCMVFDIPVGLNCRCQGDRGSVRLSSLRSPPAASSISSTIRTLAQPSRQKRSCARWWWHVHCTDVLVKALPLQALENLATDHLDGPDWMTTHPSQSDKGSPV
jgi:hypothetical protein